MKRPQSPIVRMTWTLEVADRQGRLTHRLTRPSRSYVRAFIDWMYSHFSQLGVALVPDTLGVNRTIANYGQMASLGPNDNSLFGLVLGTGTGAVLITDNKLGTQIVHGVLPNTLDHQLGEVLGETTVGGTRSFQTRRLFVNASGATITVKECGIYGFNNPFYFCLVRDLVSPTVNIPNGGTGTLIYTISISV